MIKCPQCSYSLEGLPEEYVCPECGLEYDGDTTLIRVKLHREDWKQVAIFALLTSGIAFGQRAISEPYREAIRICWFVVVSLLFVLAVYRQVFGGNGVLVINRRGVRLNHPKLGMKDIAWPDVRFARFSRWTGIFVLIGKNGETLLSLHSWQLGGQAAAQDCDYLANRFIFAQVSRELL